MDEHYPLLKNGGKCITRDAIEENTIDGSPANSADAIGDIVRSDDLRAGPGAMGRLNIYQKAAYGLGHVHNDLCAAMWFSYTLLFLQVVLEMDSSSAGAMLLLGQVIDALATPVVGILADKWGDKKAWHMTGTVLVLLSFPLIFTRCWGCHVMKTGTYLTWWMPVYYALVITIFQCGWAVVQISHLAMIPSLTENYKERSELTAIRYTASMCSSIAVYLITWSVLHTAKLQNLIGPSDDFKFTDIATILTVIGLTLSILFQIGFRNQVLEPGGRKTCEKQKISNGERKSKMLTYNTIPSTEDKIKDKGNVINFLRVPMLYHVSLLYVASRLYGALSLIYVPLFLEERLNYNSSDGVEAVASVPLVSYIASFVASLALRYKSNSYGHQVTYFFGTLTSLASCLWIALSIDPQAGGIQLYSVAALMGAGNSITMVASLCVTADLIGPHTDQGAIVYSIVTFADKLITGLAVITIENLKCEDMSECPQYYRNILAYVCGGSALLGLVTIILGNIPSYIRTARTPIVYHV